MSVIANVAINVDARNAAQQLRSLQAQSQQAQSAFEQLKRAAAGLALIQIGRQAIQAAASFNDLQLRLRLLTAQYGETTRVQRFATESARRFGLSNREAAEGVTNIYARLRPLGVSLKDIQTTFTGFNTVARLSGTNAVEASAAFTQLAQALGSGRLQGDEFRSISEQVPGILVAISQETGVAAGSLKEYAAEGKLTSEVVIAALRRIETEGAGKIAQIIQQGDVQKFKDFQNAIDDLQIAIGNELLPVISPLVKDVTSLVRAIVALPEPVKNAAVQLIRFGVQLLLVKKGIEAIILLRTGFVSAMGAMATTTVATGAAATTSASAYALYARNTQTLAAAAAGATPKLTAMRGVLSSIAALGVITVGVNIIINGLQETIAANQELKKLRGRKAAGGAAATFAGATKETVVGAQEQARKTIKAIKKEREKLNAPSSRVLQQLNIGGVLSPFGVPSIVGASERRQVLSAREREAQATLGLSLGGRKSETSVSGGGFGGGLDSGDGSKRARGGGDAARAADAAARIQAEVQGLQRQTALTQQLSFIQEQIANAEADKDQLTVIRLQNEEKLLQLQYRLAEQLAGAETTQQRIAFQSLAQAEANQIRLGTAIALSAEEEKSAEANREKLQSLLDEQELITAKINGNEAEVLLKQQIRDIMKDTKGLSEDEVGALVRGNEALKNRLKTAEEMKQIYADIGTSIKEGVVASIQGAIDGTQSLQDVATNLLQKIANQLLDIAVNLALFGVKSGTGTGGGLLGFLFRANGGPVNNGSPYIVGERGPELFVPNSSGTIIPNNKLGGGGGDVSVTVNVDASGSQVQGNEGQAKALGGAISAAVQAEIVKQQRPGGLLAGTR